MANFEEKVKKDRKKNIRDCFILLGMGVVFAAVCVLLFFSFDEVKKKVDIAKHGTLVQATITRVWDKSDDDTIEYEVTYEYEYLDKYGKPRTGTGKFTDDRHYYTGHKVWIRHNGNNEEVLASYPKNFAIAALPQVIMIVIFAAVDIFLFVGVFATAIKAGRLKGLASGKGEEIQAQIIGEEYRNNGTNTCRLKYMWEAPNGKIKEGKTKESYTSAEAQMIKDKGAIRVLYYKGESIVLDLPELTKEQKAERILARNGAYKCPYCNTIMKSTDRECPSCGAKR